jgi:hypothetical protein
MLLLRGFFDGACEPAWQAGIVDGEGCPTIARQIRKGRPSPAFRASVTVSNTDRRLLEPFLKMWEGGIYNGKESRNNWAPPYTWHCADRNVKPFLETILPYLRSKHQQAALILAFIVNKKRFKRVGLGQGYGSAPLSREEIEFRENLWNQVRLLNSKGRFSRRSRGKGVANAVFQNADLSRVL